MGSREELVNAVSDDEGEEMDMEVVDALAKNMIEGMQRKEVSGPNMVGAFVLASVITMLEDGFDEHSVYETIVGMIGTMLREPEPYDDE